jgi:hypothetical protein
MAGLQGFISGNKPSQSAQPTRTDRLAYGAKAKVPTKRSTVDSAGISQQITSTASVSGYTSIPATGRNAYSNSLYLPHQQQTTIVPKGAFDDTLTSGFEETESDMGVEQQQIDSHGMVDYNQYASIEDAYIEDVAFMEVEDAPYSTQERSNRGHSNSFVSRGFLQPHEYSKPPITDYERPDTPRGNAISGRFHQGSQNQQLHASMELRPSQNRGVTEQQLKGPKKRSRSDVGEKSEEPDASSDGEESSSGTQLDLGESQNQPFAHFLADPSRQHPDFDDQQLEAMSYKDLKDQAWEVENHDSNSTLPQELQDRAISLSDRFQRCLEAKPEQQLEFFATMSIVEWEESGDLFVGKFGDIMTKLREARQEKRKLVAKFETEVEEREAAIRGQSASLDKKLKEMRKGGEGVLQGKVI